MKARRDPGELFPGKETKVPEKRRAKKTPDFSGNGLSASAQPLKTAPLPPEPAKAEKEADENSSARHRRARRAPVLFSPSKAASPLALPQGGADDLDGMFDVWLDPAKNPKKAFTRKDFIRFGILFLCIFGFFFGTFLILRKVTSYVKAQHLYAELKEMVNEKDRFETDYLIKNSTAPAGLTISDLLSGMETSGGNSALTHDQQSTMSKLPKLYALNSDLAGWIHISGTVVDYPVMHSSVRSFYLHRDFYGNYLGSGSIYVDSRNSKNLTENRNTVIYGHNMTDGSMFATLHDFSNPGVFYNAKIEIITEDAVYVYTPFSAHESDALDNYFETDFRSDADFLNFCGEIAAISLHETDIEFTRTSRILTLSTCSMENTTGDRRFAVHAVLTQIIK